MLDEATKRKIVDEWIDKLGAEKIRFRKAHDSCNQVFHSSLRRGLGIIYFSDQ